MSAALQTLAVILLPIAIPFVRKQWAQIQQYRHTTPRAYTPSEQRRLVLIVSCITLYAALFIYLSFSREQDIYRLTQSRLAVSIDVLRRRAELMHVDLPDSFYTLLEDPAYKLAYIRLGAQPLIDCSWCSIDHMSTFTYYALGPITLSYLVHLAILALVSRHRLVAALCMLGVYALDGYIAFGGLDRFNAQTRSVGEILFIASFAARIRVAIFTWTLMVCSVEVWAGAQFPMATWTREQVNANLMRTIETLRTSNALQRNVADHKEYRDIYAQFWTRNEEATVKLNEQQEMKDARKEATDRFGNIGREVLQARQFIETTTARSCP